MAVVSQPLHSVASQVYGWWQAHGDAEPERAYLGASIIGGPCERALWYGFRWSSPRKFDGRIYRLFERGRREESVVIAELRHIGCEVSDTQPDGQQWGFKALGGHFAGHMDGAVSKTPYAEKAWAVLEVKTHSLKMFAELVSKGVQASHPTHYAQMTIYMGQMGMERAMYYAVCKDDDRIHTEWLHFDRAEYDRLMARAERIIKAAEPPPRISSDSAWYQCKWCEHHAICHGTEAARPHCRTCAHSTPLIGASDSDALWECAKHANTIPLDAQRVGCNGHRYIPILLERIGEYQGTPDGENPIYRNKLTGRNFSNGEAFAVDGTPCYSSIEIAACEQKQMLGDESMNAYRKEFDGRITK